MHPWQRPTAKPSHLRRHKEEQEARLARAEADKWQTLAGLCERVDALDAGFKTLTEGDSRRTLADGDTRRTLAFLGGRVDALDGELNGDTHRTLAFLGGRVDALDGELTGDTRRTLAVLGGRVDALDAEVTTLAEGDTHRTLAGLCGRVDALDASLAARPAGQAGAPDQARPSIHCPAPGCLLAGNVWCMPNTQDY